MVEFFSAIISESGIKLVALTVWLSAGKEMFYWDDPLEGFENLGFLGEAFWQVLLIKMICCLVVGKEGTLVRVDFKRLENPGTPVGLTHGQPSKTWLT